MASLGDLNGFLTAALAQTGYREKSYYAVPDGFALVTRLEQIEIDGRSKTLDRWSADAPQVHSLRAYLDALLRAAPGYYRVVALVVTDVPFTQSNGRVSESDALAWLRGGVPWLPTAIADRPYTAEVACTALIYEFERPAGGDPTILLPSRLDAHTHLVKSGLWDALTADRSPAAGVRRPGSVRRRSPLGHNAFQIRTPDRTEISRAVRFHADNLAI
jgi:hypothetical protein